jgi:putative nucleotidyltransferase with HDIG domain
MKKVLLEDTKAGMILAQDVILDDGRLLLLKGFTIKQRYIKRMNTYNISSVFVEDQQLPAEEIREEFVYRDAFANIRNIMEGIRSNEYVDLNSLKETVGDMVQLIMNNDSIFMTLTGIRDIDNYTFLHSIDVCIYSIITAKALKMRVEDIKELALAAVLHDIGKCRIPLSILNKPSKLSEAEFEIIKKHTLYGMEIASRLNGIDDKMIRVICQHHERWDGSGYPYGLKSRKIELGARIVSIADVYDALTANRVYRKRFMPHEAAEYLMSQYGLQFDPKIMKCFLESIAIYPENMIVLLNTGEIGRVLPSRGVRSMRPKVSIIARKNGPPVLDPYEIDLQSETTVFVVDILS